MFFRNLTDCKVITALDGTTLRELLNPLHDDPKLQVRYSIAHAIVKAGETSLPHRLKSASEVYYILAGSGLMHVDDEVQEIKPGTLIYIPPNAIQFLENSGSEDIVFLCIVDPYWRPDDEELVKGK